MNNNFIIACMALGRKYQKGKGPNLESWKQKLCQAQNNNCNNIVEIFKDNISEGMGNINDIFDSSKINEIQDEIIMTLDFQLQPLTRFTFMTDLFLQIIFT